MQHIMTDEEYNQYLKDKAELLEYQAWRIRAKEAAKRHFEQIKFWSEDGNNFSREAAVECQKDKHKEYYCDFCPFPGVIGCPYEYEVYFSK